MLPTINLPALPGGLSWDVLQLYKTGIIAVVSTAVPGDYNGDGTVDAADYTVWRDSLGLTGNNLAADGNGNGVIDAGDYDVWMAHFGDHAGSGSGSAATVPEPATLAIALIGAIVVVSRCVGGGPETSRPATRMANSSRRLRPSHRASC
jgi:hypothetical protein